MLWLAGFMGLFAAGTVAMMDFSGQADDTSDDSPVSQDDDAPFLLTSDLLTSPGQAQDTSNESTSVQHLGSLADDVASISAQYTNNDSIEGLDDREDSDLADTAFEMAESTQGTPDMGDIIEFDPDQHDLIVVWDDHLGEPPEIDLTASLSQDGLTEITMDNEQIAQVKSNGEVTPEHIAMVPLSTAHALGWADA